MSESSRGRELGTSKWVSVNAVAWALDDADVPPSLLATLVVMARHADANGKNSHPSMPTVARQIRRTKRQANRNVAELRKLGILLPGDPEAVEYLPEGQRPENYDLPIWISRSTDDTDVRGEDETPDTHDRGGMTPMTRTTDTSVSTPLTPTSSKEAFQDLEETHQPASVAHELSEERRREAIEIINRNTRGIYGSDLDRLAAVVADALTQGWTSRILSEQLARSTEGLDTPLYGLIRRIEKLGQPPAPKAETPRAPCRLHRGGNAYNCPCCWADVKAGSDPYAGREELRPDGWRDIYQRVTRPSPVSTRTGRTHGE